MSGTSRRNFLAAAGAGATAGTVTLAAGPAHGRATRPTPGSARETVVAYVQSPLSSELRLMVGEREVVVHDRDLVNRILNAAGGD